MSDIGPFPGYFLDDKQYHSRAQISWRLQSDDRLNLLSSENSTHAQSYSVKCDAHDTIANGQYGAVWSPDTHNRKKFRALHTEEAFNSLFDFSIASKDFSEIFSSKPETDESHLVQDPDRDTGAPKPTVAISLCVAVDECGLALSSNNRTPHLKSLCHFFRIVPFNFDRCHSTYRVALMVPTSKSSRKTTRGLLWTDHVILDHGQVTWATPELAPTSPNYHTTPHQPGRTFQLSIDLECIAAALHGGSFGGIGFELMPCHACHDLIP
ncbi:hypothetical protein TNCV_3741961 [Trichonephila clavipes]|nr:hypothetical protein TNCV_3741961 [Trichonephila clavipes]